MAPTFKPGDEVLVLDTERRVWMKATVKRYWAGVDISTGERKDQYDVEGKDLIGPFWGRWDAKNVRPAPLKRAKKPIDKFPRL